MYFLYFCLFVIFSNFPWLKLALGVLTSVEQLVLVARPAWCVRVPWPGVPRLLVLAARPPWCARVPWPVPRLLVPRDRPPLVCPGSLAWGSSPVGPMRGCRLLALAEPERSVRRGCFESSGPPHACVLPFGFSRALEFCAEGSFEFCSSVNRGRAGIIQNYSVRDDKNNDDIMTIIMIVINMTIIIMIILIW